MFFDSLIFIISFFLIVSAFFVISSSNPVHSVLFLILVFFNAIALLLFLNADFLAMIFLIIYVGAIAVLFLFVVMMLNIRITVLSGDFLRFLPIGIISGLIFFLEILIIISGEINFSFNFFQEKFFVSFISWFDVLNNTSNIYILSEHLFLYSYILFIVSGLILLVAMIGSIVLTINSTKGKNIRKQIIFNQLMRKNNIVLVKKNHKN
uniref:NADH-ubiquinone oxidoreductase chain 6 n=1 Tax=Clydonella sawyeri TaxID=2201168 RepID=A0A2U9DQR5_9EUKA|nr:NADH dehydrogenase subunit 6 [Clydonella sawyeri]